MDDFKITGLGDGFLIGFSYFAKDDRIYKYILLYTQNLSEIY